MRKQQYIFRDSSRKNGRKTYIFKYGMLYFGLPLGIISACIERFFDNDMSFNNYFGEMLIGEVIAKGLFYMVFIGPIYGYIAWKLNKK